MAKNKNNFYKHSWCEEEEKHEILESEFGFISKKETKNLSNNKNNSGILLICQINNQIEEAFSEKLRKLFSKSKTQYIHGDPNHKHEINISFSSFEKETEDIDIYIGVKKEKHSKSDSLAMFMSNKIYPFFKKPYRQIVVEEEKFYLPEITKDDCFVFLDIGFYNQMPIDNQKMVGEQFAEIVYDALVRFITN